MKTVPLTVRRCPQELHRTLKKSAVVNHRSLNREALTWLEQQARSEKPMTARQLAVVLGRFEKLLSKADHKAIAKGIEEARRKMANEHLH